MTVTKILGAQAGIQYQGVVDKSEADPRDNLVNALFTGQFKNGPFNKPFKVTAANIRKALGFDPENLQYQAIEDCLKQGVPFVWVMRVNKGGGSSDLWIEEDLQYVDELTESSISWDIEINGTYYEAGVNDDGNYMEDYLEANQNTLGITGEYDSSLRIYNITSERKFVRLIPNNNYTSDMKLTGNPTASIDSNGVISFWLEPNNEVPEPEPETTYHLTIDDKGLLPEENIYSGTIEPPLIGAVLSFNIQQFFINGSNGRVFNIYSDPQGLIVSPDGASWKVDKSTVAPSWDFPSADDFTTPATYSLSINKMYGDKNIIGANLEYIVAKPEFSINKGDFVFKIDATQPTQSAFKIHAGDLVINVETGDILWESPSNNFMPSYTFPNGIYVFRRSPTASTPMRWEIGGRALTEVIQFPETEYVNGLGFCVSQDGGMDSSLVKVPTSLPANITDLSRMFQRCALFNQDISGWDTSNVTNMYELFWGATAFNQPFFTNTSKVTIMEGLFSSAINFNQPLNIDISQVTSLYEMFHGASSFNQPLNFDTSKVSNMVSMFRYASAFNQDLSNWCVPLITREEYQFSVMSSLTEEHKPVWGTCPLPPSPNTIFKTNGVANDSVHITHDSGPAVTIDWGDGSEPVIIERVNNYRPYAQHKYLDNNKYTITATSTGGAVFAVQGAVEELVNWGNSNPYFNQNGNSVQTGSLIKVPNSLPAHITKLKFSGQSSFNQDISGWNVSNVTTISGCFEYCLEFNQPLNSWVMPLVNDLSNMFANARKFNQSIADWDISNIANTSGMFKNAWAYNQPINTWDMSNVVDATSMFSNASAFNQPLNNWNVARIEYMGMMFANAYMFNQDLSGWCVSLQTQKPVMFDSNSLLVLEHLPVWGTCPSQS